MEEMEKDGRAKLRASIKMEFSRFSIPPIVSALVLGKRANIGLNAMTKAIDEMSPGMFKSIKVDHDVIEGLIVRESDLRKVPEKELVPLILKHAEKIMDKRDSLHVIIDIAVTVIEEVDLE